MEIVDIIIFSAIGVLLFYALLYAILGVSIKKDKCEAQNRMEDKFEKEWESNIKRDIKTIDRLYEMHKNISFGVSWFSEEYGHMLQHRLSKEYPNRVFYVSETDLFGINVLLWAYDDDFQFNNDWLYERRIFPRRLW